MLHENRADTNRFFYLVLMFLWCPSQLLACALCVRDEPPLPKELYYENSIIPPHCIIKREGAVIDLAECKKSLAKSDVPYFIDDHSIRFEFIQYTEAEQKEGHYNSWEEYSMRYAGMFNGQMIVLLQEMNFGVMFHYPVTLMLSLTREVDKLIVGGTIYGKEEGAINDYIIKDGVLYFTEVVNHRTMWEAVLDGADVKYSPSNYDGRIVMMGAENEDNYCGSVFFHLDELITDPKNPGAYLPPRKPDKVEIQGYWKGSIDSIDALARGQPTEIYDGFCTDFPYRETYYQYYKEGRKTLTGNDFKEFVNIVKTKCEVAKKMLPDQMIK